MMLRCAHIKDVYSLMSIIYMSKVSLFFSWFLTHFLLVGILRLPYVRIILKWSRVSTSRNRNLNEFRRILFLQVGGTYRLNWPRCFLNYPNLDAHTISSLYELRFNFTSTFSSYSYWFISMLHYLFYWLCCWT